MVRNQKTQFFFPTTQPIIKVNIIYIANLSEEDIIECILNEQAEMELI